LADATLARRRETRIPIKLFVNLYRPDTQSFEVASTIDISNHGARVTTKAAWEPNQPLSVRSIRGNFYSRARVVHCQRDLTGSFQVGLEMYFPEGNWTTARKAAPQ
jgi:PilZ domain